MGGRIGFETRTETRTETTTEISTETSTETDTEPATGHGTTFHFDLPLLDSRSQADGAG
jgi:hypothetical protein